MNMYEIIGGFMTYAILISSILIIIALIFGNIALKRKIIFYNHFSYILDYFYFPLKRIFQIMKNEENLDNIMVNLKNESNREKYANTKKRLLLAPQCLRDNNCQAISQPLGIICNSCGKCQYKRIKEEAEKRNIKLYIITGSSIVKYIIKKEKFDGILVLGCNNKINKIMRILSAENIPAYGVKLLNDGCYETKANLKNLFNAMDLS